MRVLMIIGWLFAGLGGVICHVGPGQEQLEKDRLNQMLRKSRLMTEEARWPEAVNQFDEVLAELPGDRQDAARGILLEKAKAQMMAAGLPEARETLQTLLTEVREDEEADPRFVAEVRSTLANAQYYMTWLMRLEGLTEEEWKPEIESARQHYTQLLTEAECLGDDELKRRSAEDLESTIRLARMDLAELQGLPLPSQ